MSGVRGVLGACALTAVFLCSAAAAIAAPVVTEQVSLTDYGGPADSGCWRGVFAAGERFVVYHSESKNIVVPDQNDRFDIFMRDRLRNESILVSRANDGALGNDHSFLPSVSRDGRYVAFCSEATNFAPADTNGFMDVFVRDLETDQIRRVSVTQAGGQTNEKSTGCAIDSDGRYVAFHSEATNIMSGQPFNWPGLYLADLSTPTPTVTAVAVAQDGGPPNGRSGQPSVSEDARYIAFRSEADDLVSGDTNGCADMFVRDMVAGTTVRVSVADLTGAEGNGPVAGRPDITPDGRYIAFSSEASNLVEGDTNGHCDVFVHDWDTGRTELISVSSAGAQGNAASGGEWWLVAISDNGRYVAFSSAASNLVEGDTNGSWDVFVRDRVSGTTTRVSTSTEGIEGNADAGAYSVDISPDGQSVAFESYANNLVPLDVNGGPDVFVHGEQFGLHDPILLINDDDDYTNSREVVLGIDPGHYPEVRLRNEDDPWSVWEAAGTAREWTLSIGDGTKRVSIQGRSGLDESGVQYDGIVLDTAAPANASITINGGEETTIRRVVMLTLSADGAAQMRFRNETGSWSVWEAFATTREWKLSRARETKTVGFQVRDVALNDSPEVTDTIELTTFPDVPEGHWAFNEIMACVDAAIVTGYPEGAYEPLVTVTRDQMAVYISRALAGGEENVPDPSEDPAFTDVDPDHWAYKYIAYAVAQNVVQGYPEGDYRPGAAVTRDQMAVYVARSICDPTGEGGLAGYVPGSPRDFPDVPTGHWSYVHVEYCVERGVVEGYDDALYHPEWNVTRDQMAVYVARAFDLPL